MKYEYSNLSKLWGRIILLLNLEVSTRCVCWKKPPSLSATRKFSRLITFVCNAAPRFTLNYMSVRCYAHNPSTTTTSQAKEKFNFSNEENSVSLALCICIVSAWELFEYVRGGCRTMGKELSAYMRTLEWNMNLLWSTHTCMHYNVLDGDDNATE